MIENSVITDLLNSVKRLNEELNDRVKFEHTLIDTITEKDNEISRLNGVIKDARIELDSVKIKLGEMERETQKFVEFTSGLILKEGEQFVKNYDGEFEIYPERPNEVKSMPLEDDYKDEYEENDA